MTRRIDRKTASRAIDAWMRRLFHLRLQRTLERHPLIQPRYVKLLEGLRELLDPDGKAPARLLCELCLVSSLSRDDSRIPGARRR